jgi:hypothetical protein
MQARGTVWTWARVPGEYHFYTITTYISVLQRLIDAHVAILRRIVGLEV